VGQAVHGMKLNDATFSELGIDCHALFDESPLRVFNILTVDEYIELWLSQDDRPARCRLDQKADGNLLVQVVLDDQRPHVICGTVVDYSYPLGLTVTCHEKNAPTHIQQISITLNLLGNKTHMWVTHSGLRSMDECRSIGLFWHRATSRIKNLLQSNSSILGVTSSRPGMTDCEASVRVLVSANLDLA
jgi:uncharacterized protein YndB with AHSA1/START domain